MPSNVLAITSYSAMGGSGFHFALLHTPFANNVTGGVAILSGGRFAEIVRDKWEVIMKTVSDTEGTEEASWSRLQGVRFLLRMIPVSSSLNSFFAREQFSCPTDVFYNLGPAQTVKDLRTFQLSGHQVHEGDPSHRILMYKWDPSGREINEVVKEIPDPVLKVRVCYSHLGVLMSLLNSEV